MPDKSLEFHEITEFQDIKLVTRNFNFQLDQILQTIKPTGINMTITDSFIGGDLITIVKTIDIFVLGENEFPLANLAVSYLFGIQKDCKYITTNDDHFELDHK